MKPLFVSILWFASMTMVAQDEKPELVHAGDQAPVFTITALDGQVFDLSKLRGKVIYLNFFATWCGTCMQEIPYVEKDIWKGIHHPDFVMLVIGREQTNEVLTKFKDDKKFTMPIAADTNRKVYALYAPQIIPRNIVIDRTGKIIYSGQGYTPEKFEEMIKLIKSELEKKKNPK